MNVIGKYRLKQNLPELREGAIFELREYNTDYLDSLFPAKKSFRQTQATADEDNPNRSILILASGSGGICQGGWCGEETYIFPGNIADNEDWFDKLPEPNIESVICANVIMKYIIDPTRARSEFIEILNKHW